MAEKRLVIANRGEIACRIIRTAKSMDYAVAVVAPEDDQATLAARLADHVLTIESYLDITSIVTRAKEWGASLLHPGYGFLSERADFSRAASKEMNFVGPSPEVMELLASKTSAKSIARNAGVPCLDSIEVALDDIESCVSEIERLKLPFPLLVKASFGGGGRGMRIIHDKTELADCIKLASSEAKSAFGSDSVFVEPYIARARHIEVQVLGDGVGGGVALGERECSLQRRYQKVIEECPSITLSPAQRVEVCEAALAIVEKTKYLNAGTVEFLWNDDAFYFLEVNTRLQVEHPATEEVFGVDIVRAQLEIAEGRWPSFLPRPDQKVILQPSSHAIELRVLAENPQNDFAPDAGTIVGLSWPRNVRIESGVEEEDAVSPLYDSMIAKIIIHARNRELAIKKAIEALSDTFVHGVETNLNFLRVLLSSTQVQSGEIYTVWIQDVLDELLQSSDYALLLSQAQLKQIAEIASGINRKLLPHETLFSTTDTVDMHSEYQVSFSDTEIYLSSNGYHCKAKNPLISMNRAHAGAFKNELSADMSGKIESVFVGPGDVVTAGQVLLRFESMKMQVDIRADFDCKIVEVNVAPGDVFLRNNVLLRLEEVFDEDS